MQVVGRESMKNTIFLSFYLLGVREFFDMENWRLDNAYCSGWPTVGTIINNDGKFHGICGKHNGVY